MRHHWLPAAVCLWVASSLAAADLSAAEIAEGERLYRIHCQGCHGEHGKGDGPMRSQLEIDPPDLTTLAARFGGRFPAEEVHQIIDGRSETRSHGSRQMPVWGFTFQAPGQDANQEEDVRALIAALTAFLGSIQEDAEATATGEPSER